MTRWEIAVFSVLSAALAALLCALAIWRVPSGLRVTPPESNPCHREGTKRVAGAIPTWTALSISVAAIGRSWPADLILVFAAGLSVVGLIDDRRPYTSGGKVVAQLPLLTLALPAFPAQLRASPIWVWVPVALLALLVLTNAINVLDVADGLAPGVSAITLAGVGLILLQREQLELSTVSLAFAGATTGFLLFNAAPGSLVLGDTGSLALGGLVAALVPHCVEAARPWGLLVLPLLVFVPAFEVGWVSWRRVRRGLAPWHASPHHFVYWLVEKGLSPSIAVAGILVLHAWAVGLAAWLCGIDRAFEWTVIGSTGLISLSLGKHIWAKLLRERAGLRISQ